MGHHGPPNVQRETGGARVGDAPWSHAKNRSKSVSNQSTQSRSVRSVLCLKMECPWDGGVVNSSFLILVRPATTAARRVVDHYEAVGKPPHSIVTQPLRPPHRAPSLIDSEAPGRSFSVHVSMMPAQLGVWTCKEAWPHHVAKQQRKCDKS